MLTFRIVFSCVEVTPLELAIMILIARLTKLVVFNKSLNIKIIITTFRTGTVAFTTIKVNEKCLVSTGSTGCSTDVVVSIKDKS